MKSFITYQLRFFASLFGKVYFEEVIIHFGRFARMNLLPTIGTSVPFAIIIAFHAWTALELFGVQRFLSGAVSLVMFREVAPVISALIITAVSGTAIASEIALMKLRGEFTYLEVIGVSPMRFVVVPRVIAISFVCPAIFSVISITSIAGIFVYLVHIKGMAQGTFDEMWNIISIRDIVGGLTKSFIFGFIIGNISGFLGFTAEESSEGVGRASSISVVVNSLVFIIVNVILSYFIFGGFTPELR
jgi:phospholipid/cholesterol/gamma-HCH transport system permease protein